jgi:hypothetical protein
MTTGGPLDRKHVYLRLHPPVTGLWRRERLLVVTARGTGAGSTVSHPSVNAVHIRESLYKTETSQCPPPLIGQIFSRTLSSPCLQVTRTAQSLNRALTDGGPGCYQGYTYSAHVCSTHNPSSRTMAPVFTQPVEQMSTGRFLGNREW